jgi:hypothetical protein
MNLYMHVNLKNGETFIRHVVIYIGIYTRKNFEATGKMDVVVITVLGAYRWINKHTNEINTMITCRGEIYDGYTLYYLLIFF